MTGHWWLGYVSDFFNHLYWSKPTEVHDRIQAFAGLDSMQMTGENAELGTNQPGKGFVVDAAVDTR